MSLRDRIPAQRADIDAVFSAVTNSWSTSEDILERTGYGPNVLIYVEMLRLEHEGRIESRWSSEDGVHRRRLYRRASQ